MDEKLLDYLENKFVVSPADRQRIREGDLSLSENCINAGFEAMRKCAVDEEAVPAAVKHAKKDKAEAEQAAAEASGRRKGRNISCNKHFSGRQRHGSKWDG